VPPSPYRGISIESLALGMKGLRCFVGFGAGHGECQCMVVGEVVKEGRCGACYFELAEYLGPHYGAKY